MYKIISFLVALVSLTCCDKTAEFTVTVTNTSRVDFVNDMIEVDWDTVKFRLSLDIDERIIIIGEGQKQVPCQILTGGTGKNIKVIFPVTVRAGDSSIFRITTGKPEKFPVMTYGRLVTERKDDFAWENNRNAFRVYGPALEATGEISNGIDIWVKNTDSLIIDKWYKNDLAGIASYHKNHGEGLDFFKVGRTLGLGATAPYVNDSLWLGNNFTDYKILDQGPLRITFQLDYNPFNAGGIIVNEKRTISLDAYSYLNRVEQSFDIREPAMPVATGIVISDKTPDSFLLLPSEGIMAYELPEDEENGIIYCGIINTAAFNDTVITAGHLLGITTYTRGLTYIYYAGGGWSKAGFSSFAEWSEYLKTCREKIYEPLKIFVN